MGDTAALAGFHPAVRAWFERRFELGPTPPQSRGWPPIARGEDTLIAAPTGSGKTLAAFLCGIDRLYREAEAGLPPPAAVDVVYVSPLKALGVDVRENLTAPLDEIRAVARELGLAAPEIRVVVRSGDTPPSARAAMLRRPPHFLITTPESLYLLVTSARGREMLLHARTVIVDEIHAVARDKRGSHLALTLERLDALCARRPARIGLSATQRPIATLARLLVGAAAERTRADGGPACAIVDEGHRRPLDLAIETPESELAAVATGEQLDEILERIAGHVARHRTTLVFVNTRRMAERLAHRLEHWLGPERVAAHHGSLSKERRLRVEDRLRAGGLAALVATASLELGIDVGPVELCCQIGSPRSLATFLQRAGRSGHARGATPRALLFPTTRDELVECAALLRGVRAGRLDCVLPPEAPLDILAQQIVAACAADDWREDELYALVRRAAPYAALAREDFDAVVAMLAEGVATRRGRRGAYLHRDRVNGVVRGRRGARLAALTSGGAIPEQADYRVVAEPDETFVGTVNEDFAIESMAGDVFLLGSHAWRIRRVAGGVVRVVDAQGAQPTVPFWLGEAPARTAELSAEVARLREDVAERLAQGVPAAAAWLRAETGADAGGAEQIARYLDAAQTALGGVVPTHNDVVFERFFDDTGGMQLVVHAPFGGRVTRAFGLALRKRFCRSFDFELQAAANDDALVLSLGPQHSFPLADVPRFLDAEGAADVLAQAFLQSPMWTARWRWNANRALAVLRQRGGRRVPPPLQRMQSDDLLAALFPSLAACQENVTGPIEIPDHPLVRQTVHDCLFEAADAEGLRALLDGMARGRIRTHFRDVTEPSPLAHEILNGRPYTFLDEAPLEERRTRALALPRGLPAHPRDLGALDPAAVARVREEAWPAPRDADELHDALLGLGVVRPEAAWREAFAELVRAGRATALETGAGPLWIAAECEPIARALHPGARQRPALRLPDSLASRPAPDADAAALAVVRGHVECLGPCTPAELASRTGLRPGAVEIALAQLEAEGLVLRGRFDPRRAGGDDELCERRLLARIHRASLDRLRREIEPVTAQDFMRFLLRWQRVAPDARLTGRQGVLAAVSQLAGFELAAGAWEESVLPARVRDYQGARLDEACLSGEVAWGRLSPRAGAAPSRATPIALAPRGDLPWLLAAARGDARPVEPPEASAAGDVFECLISRGALFFGELVRATGRLPVEVEQGLWELVSRGLVTADGFQSVRALLGSRLHASPAPSRRPSRRFSRRAARRPGGLRRGGRGGAPAEGRWALLPPAEGDADRDALAEAAAEQLLERWGVVFRDLLARETLALPWRELLYALRRLEARGVIRGGRFVTGFAGEQYALPDAVAALRRMRRRPRHGEVARVSAADPLNLVGILLPGARVPALRGREIAYVDGLPDVAPGAPPPAQLETTP